MYKYYLVTIKTRGTPYTTPTELYDFYYKALDALKMSEWSTLRVLEYPDSGRLHFHSIVIIHSSVFYKRILKEINTNRIYMHLKEFPHKDYNKVRDYLLKQVPSYQDQKEYLTKNLMEHTNCFNRYYFDDEQFINKFYNRHPIRT